jgi:hypothetical protein
VQLEREPEQRRADLRHVGWIRHRHRRLRRSDSGTLTASLIARVLGGSGAYSGLRGTGTLQQNLTFPLPTSTLDAAIDRALQSALGSLLGSFAATLPLSFPATTAPPPPAASALGVRLTTGKPSVVFSSPAEATVKPTDVLRVATAPGANCSASAKQVLGMNKGKVVIFSSVTDRAKKGVVEFPGKLAAKLGPMVWAISVSCKSSVQRYDASGRALAAETVKAVAEKQFRILRG